MLCFFFALMLLNTERKAGRILDAKCESQLLHTEDVKSDCRMEKIAPKLGKKLLQCEKKEKQAKHVVKNSLRIFLSQALNFGCEICMLARSRKNCREWPDLTRETQSGTHS